MKPITAEWVAKAEGDFAVLEREINVIPAKWNIRRGGAPNPEISWFSQTIEISAFFN